MLNKSAIRRWIIFSITALLLLFSGYLWQLNNQVVKAFSTPPSADDISYHQQSKVVMNMLLLVEDQSYFQHAGVDLKEIMRVLRDYLLYDKPLRGASTITQQLVKNTLLSRERTLSRKIKEILMALLLEHSFDKEFILNRYMNRVYLGQNGAQAVRGFHQAAVFYFHKPVSQLSLKQMATLVALVKGPSYYHPVKHPQRLAQRRQLVLRLYQQHKKIVK